MFHLPEPCRRLVIAAFVVVTPLLAGCSEENSSAQAPADTSPPASVTVAPVAKVAINPEREFVGQTQAVDTVDLRARIQGLLEKRQFVEGSDVREGDVLFALERAPFQAAIDVAAAKLAEAKAEVTRTQREMERARALFGQGNVSLKVLDQATTDHLRAEAIIRGREADLRQAQIDFSYTTITAPFDGRIGRSTYSVGNLIGPNSGVLATLIKLNPIYVVFNVSDTTYLDAKQRLGRGSRDRPATVPRLKLSNGASYPFEGRIDFIGNQVDPTTGTIPVRAVFPNPERLLLPGQFVTVVERAPEATPALLIPQAAVQQDQGGYFVLVVTPENKVEVRRIKVGERIGINWQVTDGLGEGEHVIYEGIQKVRPGVPVAPVIKVPVAPTAG